jgi:hypothetical protein
MLVGFGPLGGIVSLPVGAAPIDGDAWPHKSSKMLGRTVTPGVLQAW